MDVFDGLTAQLQQIASGTVDRTADFIIDGVDLRKRAPNAIRWVADPEYLNIPQIYYHVRQYQIIRDLFQLRCPICNRGSHDCWGKTEDELRAEVLLEYDAEANDDRCPKCLSLRAELVEDGLLATYDTMIGIAGMRSGKSVVAGMIGTYVRHVLVTLAIDHRGALHEYFHILPTQNLELAFVASSETQSNQTIWANFFKQCDMSPWFKLYRRWIVAKMEAQPAHKGLKGWRYQENESEIIDDWCMLNCVSLHSNSSSLAGRTRVGFFADELARFSLTESKTSADEVWAVFDHSLKTVRGAVIKRNREGWLGLAVAISSPISVVDKIMQLYVAAKTIPRHFAWKYATWEFNPDQPYSNFESDFLADPVKAMRDFGANPPNAASPLVSDPLRYYDAVDVTAKPSAEFETFEYTDVSGREYISAKLLHSYIDATRPLYIFADAGATFDQFAMVACSFAWLDHYTTKSAAELVEERHALHIKGPAARSPYFAGTTIFEPPKERTLVTYHEWSMRIIPKKGKSVWFDAIVEILRQVKNFRAIAMFGADHWNSESTLQQVSNMGIPSQKVQLKVEDYTRAVQDAMVKRLRLLPAAATDQFSLDANGTVMLGIPAEFLSPAGATLYETFRLELAADLRSVGNPEKGKVRGRNSDDLSACLVGAHRLVQESHGKVKADERMRKHGLEVGGAANFQGGLVRSRLGM